jgi:hypothetical protein
LPGTNTLAYYEKSVNFRSKNFYRIGLETLTYDRQDCSFPGHLVKCNKIIIIKLFKSHRVAKASTVLSAHGQTSVNWTKRGPNFQL